MDSVSSRNYISMRTKQGEYIQIQISTEKATSQRHKNEMLYFGM